MRSVQLSATNDDLRRSDRANVKYTHSYNTPSEYGSQWVMGDSSDEEYSNILQMLVVCPKSHAKEGVAEKLRDLQTANYTGTTVLEQKLCEAECYVGEILDNC